MSMTTSLLLSMSEIASLARVRRPVVSMWRTRAATSDLPFPDPVTGSGVPALFDSEQVVRWLEQTGRGKNASASRDIAAHAGAPDGASFDSVSALIALRAATGRSLSNLSVDDLVDLADAADPDDTAFFSEVAALTHPAPLARYVDELADAAYGDAAAYERMLAAERRRADTAFADALVTADGVRLLARIVRALDAATAHDTGVAEPLELVDSTGGAVDVIVELGREENVAETVTRIADSGDADSNLLRRARRRLVAHRIDQAGPASTSAAQRVLHLLVMGSSPADAIPGSSPADALAVKALSAVDDLAMRLDGSQLALVVAPSPVLSDAGLDREPDQLRSGVLRSGQVRAIVRLPAGLRPGMPRQSLTLWVMGAAHPDVELANRWTMIADLSTTKRDATFDSDLISDLAASLGDHSALRAHAFRFARLVFTRHLLARQGSLMLPVPTSHPAQHGALPVDESVKLEKLLTELSWPTDAVTVAPVLTPEQPARTRVATLDKRITARHLRYLPGNRLDLDLIDNAPAGSGRIAVLGVEELTGDRPLGRRSIDRSRFVTELPSGRFTQPGDVVFCTSPRPQAIVDHDGLSVVLYPARILRIRPDGDDKLLPDVLAADINARAASDSSWRSWPSRGVDPHQRAALSRTIDALRTDREATRRRLAQLDQLESTLIDGVTRGDLQLTTSPTLHSPALTTSDRTTPGLTAPAPPEKGTP